MREPIENEYFNWLCAKVLDRGTRSYNDFLGILHTTEFTWTIHEDGRRASDGLELRDDFLRETHVTPDGFWGNEPCSIFEMLIAFAKRASFQTDIPVKNWFWEFLTNLQLDQFRQVSDQDAQLIQDILHAFIWRTYDSRGFGGMFPMSRTQNDQREIEIWYQFCEYLDDRGLL